MEVAARPATPDDIDIIVTLYRALEEEMASLTEIWPLADGLPEPAADAVARLIEGPHSWVYVGQIDAFPVGFLVARSDPLLPQAGNERVASVQLVFTDPEARGVGVGGAMLLHWLDDAAAAGHRRFDGNALPGHREAKSFFESHGFTTRRLLLHRSEPMPTAAESGGGR